MAKPRHSSKPRMDNDEATRNITLNRLYSDTNLPPYFNSPEIKELSTKPFGNVFEVPKLEVIPPSLAYKAVIKHGADRAETLVSRLLRNELLIVGFAFAYDGDSAEVFRQSSGNGITPKFEVTLAPDEATIDRLSEVAKVIKDILMFKDFHFHTRLPVAEFISETDANTFADELSPATAGGGVLHFGLPINVFQERDIAFQAELARITAKHS